MRDVRKALYSTAEELAQRVAERDAQSSKMSDGPAKQAFLSGTAILGSYLDLKLWIASAGARKATRSPGTIKLMMMPALEIGIERTCYCAAC